MVHGMYLCTVCESHVRCESHVCELLSVVNCEALELWNRILLHLFVSSAAAIKTVGSLGKYAGHQNSTGMRWRTPIVDPSIGTIDFLVLRLNLTIKNLVREKAISRVFYSKDRNFELFSE